MPLPRYRHLYAAGAAVLIAAALVCLLFAVAVHLENHFLGALIPENSNEKDEGVILQRKALARPDVLTLYGTSELLKPIPTKASVFFRHRPSGFLVNPVGKPGATSLVMAERIGALGEEARGRKLVICLSPSFFYTHANDPDAYAHNFSPVIAGECLFNSRLSWALRRRFAQRMAEFPETLRAQPRLTMAIQRLEADSPASRALYTALLPIQRWGNALLRVQDHLRVARYVEKNRDELHPPRRKETALEWDRQIQDVDARSEDFHGPPPEKVLSKRVQTWWTRGGFRAALRESPEWRDLDLLLWTLREVQADSLVLCIPLNGCYLNRLGLPAAERAAFYHRLEQLCQNRDVPVLDFREYEEDPHFFADTHDHLAPKGWLVFDETLDDFFHDRPLLTASTPREKPPLSPASFNSSNGSLDD